MNNRYSIATNWLISHARALLFSLGAIIKTPLASVMTLAVIAIATALPTGFYLLLSNVQKLTKWDAQPRISLYLKAEVSEAELSRLQNALTNSAQIAKWHYISPEQGLAELQKRVQFGGALAKLNKNPLPGVIVITAARRFNSPNALQQLWLQLKQWPQVEQAQLDLSWVKRLTAIVSAARRTVDALTVLLGLGLVLVIGNTIRLTTREHQQEISVLDLIGASRAFIRRPLLYRGFMYGLLGGVAACLLVALVAWWLRPPLQAFLLSYYQRPNLQSLSLSVGAITILSCAILGWLGAVLAV